MEWDRLLCDVRIRDLYEKPIKRPPESRSQFERDYDRAIFSTPVRRLQDKAQVFPLEPSDAVRTRLTHSLEVSTVARDVARQVGRWLLEKRFLKGQEQANHIETIATTCGLIHDLGNPPFGHAGEQAIAGWCEKFFKRESKLVEDWTDQMKHDFLRFEGNAQTIRLVSKLQVLADDHGLNFTCGTLSAACKYTAASHALVKKETGPHHATKSGYFASEAALIKRVREQVGTEATRNPITYLVEACDDMVYSTVDLEDGVKKGVVDWNTVEKELMGLANEHVKPCVQGRPTTSGELRRLCAGRLMERRWPRPSAPRLSRRSYRRSSKSSRKTIRPSWTAPTPENLSGAVLLLPLLQPARGSPLAPFIALFRPCNWS